MSHFDPAHTHTSRTLPFDILTQHPNYQISNFSRVYYLQPARNTNFETTLTATVNREVVGKENEDLQFEPQVIAAESIVTPKLILECEADEDDPELIATAMEESISALHPMWNLVNKNFFLFWGDITSHRFNEHLPDDAFVLATPDTTGQQTWLVKNTRSSIAIDKSQLDKKIVSGFLEVIANGQKAIVFPWLPSWKVVNIALELNLMVYAADADLRHCERLLSQLGFDLQRIQRIL